MAELSVVGKDMQAVGSRAIVIGKTVYSHDLELPNMLIGKLLYSPHASARIVRLDVSKARALPGVAAVMTAEDVPGENNYLYWYTDQPLIVADQVRYQGDIVAAVAAETEEAALAALEMIEVEYEPLEPICDPEAAMQPDSPRVWADKDNVHSREIKEWGDIEAGFAQADVIVEHTYRTQFVEHAMMETEGAIATVDQDGTIVVYASAQAPHRDRMQIARALGVPESQVREITPPIGGGFGAKDEANIQIHAALLAYKTGLPVKIVRTREESIRTHVKRHPATIHYKTGATQDGKLTAIHMTLVGDTGPYINAGEEVMGVMASYGLGPYKVPNAKTETYTVLTNNPIGGAMRGFGVPQITFAIEQNMDELARRLDMDPLELRELNGLQTGDQFQPKAVVPNGDGMHACLQKLSELSHWDTREADHPREPEPHLRRGWGLAMHYHKAGWGKGIPDHAAASASMAPDGSVTVRTGAADMGQGTHTVIAQFAAERLGVEPEQVKIIRPDTAIAADAGATVGSRATLFSGNAIIRAAEPIRETLLELAAEETGIEKDLLDLRLGYAYAEGERISLTVSDLAAKAYDSNLPMQGSGHYAVNYPDAQLPDGSTGYYQMVNFGAQCAQVLVDIETGQIQVEHVFAVQDVGQVVNPKGVRGQIEGAISMGFGYSLLEELIVEQGKTLNNSLESYLIPTAFDTPPITFGVVEVPEDEAPLGAKGIGEPPTNLTAAAIANAVADAIGVHVRQLPLSSERVLAALQTKPG